MDIGLVALKDFASGAKSVQVGLVRVISSSYCDGGNLAPLGNT